jgi:hypothetical protein
MHGDGGPAAVVAQAVVGCVCPCCGGNFRSRTRLLRHMVHGARACIDAAACLPPLPAEVIEAAAVEDRAARAGRRKRGMRDHSGLPYVRAAPAPAAAAAGISAEGVG